METKQFPQTKTLLWAASHLRRPSPSSPSPWSEPSLRSPASTPPGPLSSRSSASPPLTIAIPAGITYLRYHAFDVDCDDESKFNPHEFRREFLDFTQLALYPYQSSVLFSQSGCTRRETNLQKAQ